MVSPDWPSNAEAESIFQRLLQLDPTAESDLAIAYLTPLTNFLLNKPNRIDPHFCDEAAESALLNLIERPGQFDSSRSELGQYLRMSADRDLKNLLAKERRITEKLLDFGVELLAEHGNKEQEESPVSWDDPLLQAALAELPPTDRAAIELIRSGERSREVFAELDQKK